MNKDLEKYISDYSSPEDQVLKELYRITHTSVINPHMVSGHLQGKVLEMLVSMINPSLVLEIGTYTGYSAISMALAMSEGSTLHTIEINDELYDLSSSFIKKAGLEDIIVMHTGDAKTIIPELNLNFDLVFIDGDKREYPAYYELVLSCLKPGGFILVDNVLWDGKVFDPGLNDPMTSGIKQFNRLIKNNPNLEQVILPLRDGLMLIRKKVDKVALV